MMRHLRVIDISSRTEMMSRWWSDSERNVWNWELTIGLLRRIPSSLFSSDMAFYLRIGSSHWVVRASGPATKASDRRISLRTLCGLPLGTTIRLTALLAVYPYERPGDSSATPAPSSINVHQQIYSRTDNCSPLSRGN